MKKPIYPCLWFNNNAAEAAGYYCSVFEDSELVKETPMVSTFVLNGTKFMGLNGGPMHNVNSSISYFVYCGGEKEINRLFKALSKNGRVIFPLDTYAWADKYAWVVDQFGVNWQLDGDPINNDQKIVPTLLFGNEKMTEVKNAVSHYTSIFKNSKILLEAPFADTANLPKGSLLFAQFKLNDFIFNAMSSPKKLDYDFSPGNSFIIECETQAEIYYYWEKLGLDRRYDKCGWLADKYGVSWQIIPTVLSELMEDPERGPRVVQEFLKMQKFDIETLKNA